MPPRPRRPCTTPGCPGRADTGRCEQCRARCAQDSAHERGYDHRWRIRALSYLIRHPRCTLCPRAAVIADHWPRSRRQLVAAGVDDPDADEHLRPLCDPCHRRETARHQPGGWYRDRERGGA